MAEQFIVPQAVNQPAASGDPEAVQDSSVVSVSKSKTFPEVSVSDFQGSSAMAETGIE